MFYLKTFESYNFIGNSTINKTNIKAVQGLSEITINQDLYVPLNDVSYTGVMNIESFISELSIMFEMMISLPNSKNISGIAIKTSDKSLKKMLNSDAMSTKYKDYFIFKLT